MPETIQYIKFTELNIRLILSGIKTQTRRPFDPDIQSEPKFKVGVAELTLPNGKRTGKFINIYKFFIERLFDICDDEILKEGYCDIHEFESVWSGIYNSENKFAFNRNPMVYVYEFFIVC